MSSYYSCIILMSVALAVVMVLFVRGNVTLPRQRKVLFIWIFCTVIVGSACEWLGVFLSGSGPQVSLWLTMAKVVEFSAAPVLAVLYAAVFTSPEEKYVRIALLACALHGVLELALCPFDLVIKVDEMGVYHHGPAYIIYIMAYVASAVFLVVETKRCNISLQYRNRHISWVIIGFVAVCLIVQQFTGDVRFSWLGLSIAASLFYIFYSGIVQQSDALTLLLNRYSYESSLAQLEHTAAVLFIDVDDFKSVNDNFGHAKGDEVLQIIAHLIYEVFGNVGSCYRIGGDEFCVIATGATYAEISELSDQLSAVLENRRHNNAILPTVSIGYAEFNPANSDVDDVCRRADEMMYQMKKLKKSAA